MKRYRVVEKKTGEVIGDFDTLRESKEWIRMGDQDTWADFHTHDAEEDRYIELNDW